MISNGNILEEWWSEWQVEIVEDSSRIWSKKQFKLVPGFWVVENGNRILGKLSEHKELPEGATIDNTAWDHEHCCLCWDKISEYPNDKSEGYTDGDEWVCVACYDKYISSRLKAQ